MSAGDNAGQLARIEQHLAGRYIDKGKLAGTLTAVWRRGELTYLKPQGQRDLASGAPMAEDRHFPHLLHVPSPHLRSVDDAL